MALEDFTIGGHDYARGSALLRVRANPDSLHAIVAEVARHSGVPIRPTDSGRAEAGPDLGGNRFPVLEAPRIALLCGQPVSFTSYGSLWHLLDHDLETRVSSLDIASMADLDLSKYNVIVLPDAYGGGSAYARALGPAGCDNLRTWVKAGGTLIAIGAGAAFAADSSQALSTVRLREHVLGKFPPAPAQQPLPESPRLEALGDTPRPPVPGGLPLLGAGARSFVLQVRPPGVRLERLARAKPNAVVKPAEKSDVSREDLERADARLRRFRPRGALVRVDVDDEDWLTGGVAPRLPVLAANDLALIARAPVRVAARYTQADSLHLSGLLWPEAAARLARTAVVTRESQGKGQVILFAVDPTLRRAMRGCERLLLNAMLLGPGLGTSRPAPW